MKSKDLFSVAPLALRDLDEIWSYIARDNPDAADRFLDELERNFVLLASNRRIGREKSGWSRQVRMFPYKKYLIYYSVETEQIEIIRVVHSARDQAQFVENDFEN